MLPESNFPDLPALSEVADEAAPSIHLRDDSQNGYGVQGDFEPITVGDETLADLPRGPAPAQLVPPFLTPEGPTIIYGPGGVGKGLLGVYFARELVHTGRRVTIVDFENHPREWGRRACAMGYSEADLLMVNYRAPFGHAWTAPTGSLAEIVPQLLEDLEVPERHADYLIIDSFTMATSTGDAMGGMAAAAEFFGGLARLRRPAMVIAHIAGGQDKWPDKPFGSVFVHNLARETWAVERTAGEEPEGAPNSEVELGPMTLELRNKKSNTAATVRSQFFTFSFEDEVIQVDRTPPFTKTWAEVALEMLSRTEKMSTKELSAAFKADEGITAHPEAIRKTLTRQPGRFRKTQDVPYRWELVK